MKTTYLSCADTAKLVRAALKKAFPAVKFSVRSHTYSGGASIDVKWIDGPCAKAVEQITEQYRGGDFDGSIDMAITHTSWLLPDGTACIASNPGTAGSKGCIPAHREWMPSPEAQLVHFGANYIFCTREVSPALLRRVVDRLAHKGYPVDVLTIKESNGHAWVEQTTYDQQATRGFDMQREVHMHISRTHCMTSSK